MDTVVVLGWSPRRARRARFVGIPAGLPTPLGPSVESVPVDLEDEGALSRLPLGDARALILASDDERLNLKLALFAAEAAARLRIVVRLFDMELGRELERERGVGRERARRAG